MSLLFPDNSEGDGLQYFVNKATPQDLMLRLFTNNVTPAETDTAATYTEAAGSGYAAIQLVGANWVIAEGAPSSASYAQQTFTFTGALGNIYGYFFTRFTSGRIAGVERFPSAPYNIVNNGDNLKVTPQITLD